MFETVRRIFRRVIGWALFITLALATLALGVYLDRLHIASFGEERRLFISAVLASLVLAVVWILSAAERKEAANHLAVAVFGGGLVLWLPVALVFWVVGLFFPHPGPAPPPPLDPVDQMLEVCSPFTNSSASKSAEFEGDGRRVTVTIQAPHAAAGSPKQLSARGRYFVSYDQQEVFVHIGEAIHGFWIFHTHANSDDQEEVCVLTPEDPSRTNLRDDWFGYYDPASNSSDDSDD